jgi:hypothetical protein
MSNFSHAKINNNFKFHYWDPHYTLSANPDPTKAQNNKRYTCNFCNATFSGSAGRARSHIAGRAEPGKPKEVKDCPNPDPEIQRQILEEYAVRQQVLDDAKKRKLGEEQMIAPATFNVSPLAYADVELSSDSEPVSDIVQWAMIVLTTNFKTGSIQSKVFVSHRQHSRAHTAHRQKI